MVCTCGRERHQNMKDLGTLRAVKFDLSPILFQHSFHALQTHTVEVLVLFLCNKLAPLPELMDRKKRDIMERKGDKEDENKRQKQQKESSAAAL